MRRVLHCARIGEVAGHASRFVLMIRGSSRCATPAATVIEELTSPGATTATSRPSQKIRWDKMADSFPNLTSAVLLA